MRPTSLLGLAGLAVVGFIIADFLIHPDGTKAVGQGLVSVSKPTINGLLGQPTS